MRQSVVRFFAALVFAFSLAVLPVLAQDAQMTLRLSMQFRTLKNSERMSDETRKLVEELEAKGRPAPAAQNDAAAVKYYNRARALVRNQPWTRSREMAAAMQIKLERAVFDPGDKARIEISQLFAPDEPIAGKLSGSI